MKRSTRGSLRNDSVLSSQYSSSSSGQNQFGSYESSHLKRVKPGSYSAQPSISGRLRSCSDLESTGVIDKRQKGVLKDLIIAGGNDDQVQRALDEYEQGDGGRALEDIIGNSNSLSMGYGDSNGQSQNQNGNDAGGFGGVDLLEDLDLDVLMMGNGDRESGVSAGNGAFDDIGDLDFNDGE